MSDDISHIADLNAERALISSCILDPNMLAEVQSGIVAADFFDQRHALIWRALCEATVSTDVVSLYTLLGTNAEKVGLSYVAELGDLVGSTLAAPSYAATVALKATVRRTLGELHALTASARTNDPADWLAATDAFALTTRTVGRGRQGESAATVADRVWNEYISDDETKTDLTPTGIVWLDRLHGGGFAAALHVIAAPTGGGKSALADQIGDSMASQGIGKVLSFSGEMQNHTRMQRIMAQRGPEFAAITRRARDPQTLYDTRTAFEGARESNLVLFDVHLTLERVTAEALRAAARSKVAAVIVDYYQIIRTIQRFERPLDRLVHVSIELMGLAQRIQAPVFVLSQVKSAVTSEKRLPAFGDLADCAQLANYATSITMPCLHRKIFGGQGDPGECTIVIAKSRNGREGTSRPGEVRFDGPHFRFNSGGF